MIVPGEKERRMPLIISAQRGTREPANVTVDAANGGKRSPQGHRQTDPAKERALCVPVSLSPLTSHSPSLSSSSLIAILSSSLPLVSFPPLRMKRTSAGISLKRPAPKLMSSQDPLPPITLEPTLSPPPPSPPLFPPTETVSTSTTIPEPSFRVLETVTVEIPVRKTILKIPGTKSPVRKKVEFVNDSEGSLSDPDDDDDDLFGSQRSSGSQEVNLVKLPEPAPTKRVALIKEATASVVPESPPPTRPESPPLPAAKAPSVKPKIATSPPKTVASPPKIVASPPKTVASPPKTVTSLPKPRPVPKVTKVELSDDDDDMEEEDEYGDDGEDNSGSDYDSEDSSRKRVRTGRVTHQSIKANLLVARTRTSRSGRPALAPLKVTISSKPLPTTKAAMSDGKALVSLGKRFKVPTFTKPGTAPEPTRPGTYTLGAKRRPAVEGRSAHDYTMEGSIILYDPAWAVLDEAQKEEEKLLSASQEHSKDDDENSPPQVIIPKKEKAKSKSIAEILGLTKTKEVPKVHVVVSDRLSDLGCLLCFFLFFLLFWSNRTFNFKGGSDPWTCPAPTSSGGSQVYVQMHDRGCSIKRARLYYGG